MEVLKTMKVLERKIDEIKGWTLLLAGIVFLTALIIHSNALAEEAIGAEGVEPIQVCMVNDRVMGKPQIPVEYDGKTYYGCCQGCVKRIKNDRAIRYSTDPVTGAEVDKAGAYIVEAPGGEALYFESAETASKYKASGATGTGPLKQE